MDDYKILDGQKLARKREEGLKKKVQELRITPCGVNILIGDDPSSVLYTQIKEKKAAELGINFQTLRISLGVKSNPSFDSAQDGPPRWDEVCRKIEEMNKDPNIHGIMVQLPVPEEFLGEYSLDELLGKIDPQKDIDGLTKQSRFLPAAVGAVLSMITDENIEVKDKKVVVVGASDLVGKPAAKELEKRGALVEVCDSKTKDLGTRTKTADILVSATGVPGLISGEMVKDEVVVIDVGASSKGRSVSGREIIVGDVDFKSVYPKASKITPVPGGVGPMTVVTLLENVVKLVCTTGN